MQTAIPDSAIFIADRLPRMGPRTAILGGQNAVQWTVHVEARTCSHRKDCAGAIAKAGEATVERFSKKSVTFSCDRVVAGFDLTTRLRENARGRVVAHVDDTELTHHLLG